MIGAARAKAEPGPVIQCRHCNGTGKVELPGGGLRETYDALVAALTPTTSTELGKKLRVIPTAMCNRLVALEALGLARGERHGRKRLWVALKPKPLANRCRRTTRSGDDRAG